MPARHLGDALAYREADAGRRGTGQQWPAEKASCVPRLPLRSTWSPWLAIVPSPTSRSPRGAARLPRSVSPHLAVEVGPGFLVFPVCEDATSFPPGADGTRSTGGGSPSEPEPVGRPARWWTGAERAGAARPLHGASPAPFLCERLTCCLVPRSRLAPPFGRRCAVAAPTGSRRSARSAGWRPVAPSAHRPSSPAPKVARQVQSAERPRARPQSTFGDRACAPPLDTGSACVRRCSPV
jgi:hypothetical protein